MQCGEARQKKGEVAHEGVARSAHVDRGHHSHVVHRTCNQHPAPLFTMLHGRAQNRQHLAHNDVRLAVEPHDALEQVLVALDSVHAVHAQVEAGKGEDGSAVAGLAVDIQHRSPPTRDHKVLARGVCLQPRPWNPQRHHLARAERAHE